MTGTSTGREFEEPATGDSPDAGRNGRNGSLAHPLDAHVVDPTDMPPLCGEDEFAELMSGMVTDNAPRVFAVVREYGERVDARVAAWGMAFEDHAEVVAVDGTVRMRVAGPEQAARRFRFGSHIGARVVWPGSNGARELD
ncbi:hypothetical protein SAMN04487904_10994 [Actinopolyspora lacussalsi subsp. righensis]|uniref:Uncharacterized protein n=1 Tax=Actinopolyspora righensis TaxID=995060 RepID=A0A1I7B431_9ACTN|nr:hypothetical protein [Actinopolyspora righensis]SFT81919.1 hypothetical protein SAMN04487904_10994 [Actinopolyspora righensis]